MNAEFPRPGLQGDYRDTCVACLKGTDTCFATEGEAEFHIAALMVAAEIPAKVATEMMRAPGAPPGTVPDGEYVVFHRLCGECAEKTGKVKVGLMGVGLDVPVYRPNHLAETG